MGNKPKDERSSLEQFTDELSDIFKRGKATVVERNGKITVKPKPSEIGQASAESDTIDKVNKALANDQALAEFQEFLKSRGFEETIITKEKKRIYRRKSELPNPEKSRWAAENRVNYNLSKKQVNLRLDPELLQIVEAAAEQSGLNRTSWMTAAFIRAAREEGFDVPGELEPAPDGP